MPPLTARVATVTFLGGLLRPGLVGGVLSALALLCGCSGGEVGEDTARAPIKRVIDQGRAALASNRPDKFCALLTSRARTNSLGFGSEYNGSGLRDPDRAPRTCTAAIADQLRFARASRGGLQRLRSDSEKISFVAIDDRSAHVRLEPAGINVYLVKTASGWRADRTDDFPFDGSTGA